MAKKAGIGGVWGPDVPLTDRIALHAGSVLLGDGDSNVEGNIYSKYWEDPVAFGEEVLGETYTDDVKRLMESVRDNVITVAESANAVGKTHAAARVATWFYKTQEQSKVFTAAAPPIDNLKRILWGEIGGLALRHPAVFSRDKVSTASMEIKRNDESFIVGLTIPMTGTEQDREARFSGKHAPFMLFILDEGDAIPWEVYRGIASCMSGGFARLLILFNPRNIISPPATMLKEGRAARVSLEAFNHPNVITGEDVYPGAVTKEVTAYRINEWTRPLLLNEKTSDPDAFQIPEYFDQYRAETAVKGIKYPPLRGGQWRKVTEPSFSYMVLARYPMQSENQLISEEWLTRARERYDLFVAKYGVPEIRGAYLILGLDVADMGKDFNVLTPRWGNLVGPPERWSGVDTTITADLAAGHYNRLRADQCNVDSTGVGAGVAPAMERQGCRAYRIMVSGSPTESSEMGNFRMIRDQGWWAVREWLRKEQAMLPPDEELLEDLRAIKYFIDLKGMIKIIDNEKIRQTLKRSPDSGTSLMMTFCPDPEDIAGELTVTNYIEDGDNNVQPRRNSLFNR